MNQTAMRTTDSPEINYAKLRVSLELFQRPPASLNEEEYQQMLQQVNRESAISHRVLASEEAVEVVVPESAVHRAFQALRKRYDTEEAFDRALQANELDREGLHRALEHELRVEAVLEKVLAKDAAVSDEEVEIYYYQHLERFELPETRTARHILITINDDYAENGPDQARQRINTLASQLKNSPSEFKSLAQRHSECPTAMHEGLLGRIKPGQLYPELDGELFRLKQGEISTILHSPVGLHLLQCETIHPAERLTFEKVREKLHEHLENKKRKHLLQTWLKREK